MCGRIFDKEGAISMAWLYLFLAGLCEIVWANGLNRTEGLTSFLTDPSKIWTTAWTILVMLLSFWLLSMAMKQLPLGTAYAVWTGIGAVGTVIYGMLFMNEPRDGMRMLCMMLITVGIVGLKVVGK